MQIEINSLPNGGPFCGFLLLQTNYNIQNLGIPRMIKWYCNNLDEISDLQSAVNEYNSIGNRRAIDDSRLYMLVGTNPVDYFDERIFQIQHTPPLALCKVNGRLSYVHDENDDMRVTEMYSWPWSAVPLNGLQSPDAFEHARKFIGFLPYTKPHTFSSLNTVESSMDIETANVTSRNL